MSYDVEKDWTTSAGFRAVVIQLHGRHRCGYVGIPSEHPLYGVGCSEVSSCLRPLADDEPIGKRGIIPLLCYDKAEGLAHNVAFNVHGSLTFASDGDYPVENDGLWWFGFDCNHYYDNDNPRSLEYCIDECESLARQLIERVEGATS